MVEFSILYCLFYISHSYYVIVWKMRDLLKCGAKSQLNNANDALSCKDILDRSIWHTKIHI